MSAMTAVVLGALGLYVLAMISGHLPTDFSLFLFLCTLVSGLYFAADALFFAPQRRVAAQRTAAEFDQRNGLGAAGGTEPAAQERAALVERMKARPWWLEYTAGFFPVILLVFLLRSFLFEPFRIPSGSMIPTLEVGDLILVNKYEYGIRLPIVNRTVVQIGQPKRGDVIVFRYPHDTTQDYIKRIVGLPGDRVEYRNHALKINGVPVVLGPMDRYYDPTKAQTYQQYREKLGDVEHRIIWAEGDGTQAFAAVPQTNPGACVYSDGGVECTVPAGSFFVMGDNRDNSEDSRFWGFVPDRNIVGHAFFIWMNFGNVRRIGSFH
jgi:signal peptidase I